MTVSATTVTQYYTGIFRQAPSAAVSSAYQAMANDAAALNSMLSAANVQVDPVVRLYQTAFNRLPDTAGMTAWVVPFSTNQISLQQIANGFTQSTEFTTLYPASLSNAQFVGALYWNILQRAGEDAGIKGWTSALDSGALTRAQVLLGFSESAEFTAKIEPNVNTFLTNIANTPVANQGAATLYSGNLFDVNGGTVGPSFALTTGVDNITMTTAYSTVNGTNTTLQAFDTVVGSAGSDTLNYVDTSVAGGAIAAATISGVEVINIRALGGSNGTAGTSETQAVALQGTVTVDGNFGFLGVNTAVVQAQGSAAAVAAAVVANKANVLAGAQAIALGITDISTAANSGVLTLTYAAARGNVALLPAQSASNGITALQAVEVTPGVAPVAATNGNVTASAGIFVGAQQLWADRGTQAVTFTDVANGTTLGLRGDGSTTNGTLTGTYVASAKNAALAISGDVLGSPAVTINGAAIETARISASGAKTSDGAAVGAIQLSNGNTVTSVAIDAATRVTTGNITGFSTTSPTTMTVSGAGLVAVGTLDATLDTVDASTNSGGFRATINSATAKVTGSSTNDQITVGNLVLTTGTVDAGGGTADQLRVTNSNAITLVTGAKYSNFEILGVAANVSVDTDNLTANNTFTGARYASGGEILDMTAAMAANITAVANGTYVFGVKDATTPGTANSLNITADDGASTTGTVDLGAFTAAGVETITLNAVDNIVVTGLTNATDLQTLTLTGAGTQSITSDALALNVSTVINGSAATGVLTINLTGATARGAQISGGTAADIITGSDQVDSISGNAGNDRIQSLGGIDTVDGGAGNDLIAGGDLADRLTGGDGVDTFIALTAATSVNANGLDVDRITDFVAGTDKIGLTSTGVASALLDGVTLTAATAAVATVAPMLTNVAEVNSIANVYTQLGTTLDATTFAASAANGQATVARVVEFTTGSAAGKYLVINDDTAGFSGAVDIVINITGITGTLSASDFSFSANFFA